MEYIYDIVLNFQNKYYEFYEWHHKDKLINVKKILVYKISNEDYLDLKYNEVIIDIKQFPKQAKMILVTNGEEVMGILLDQLGKVIKKSSILIDEAEEILEEIDIIKNIKINYLKNNYKNRINISRIEEEKKKFIENFLSTINIEKDEYLLKYIYYDIYQKEESNINVIYQSLKKLINTNINQIYKSIKKINLELNKN